MRRLLEIGNRYAAKSDWKDFALTKLCLCSMGILIGIALPSSAVKAAALIAAGVFVVTYAFLMKKVFRIAKEIRRSSR